MTDEEINIAVARKLGWERCNDEDEGEIRWHSDRPLEPGTFGGTCTSKLPNYCHDIKAAFEIWYKFNELATLTKYNMKWILSYGRRYITEADTAPMAICLAFLKLP